MSNIVVNSPSLSSLLAKGGRALEDQLIRANCEDSLHDFVREFWFVVEPGRPFVDNWHLRWMCAELEAITEGRTTRILFNVPPGAMKSLMMVFWTCWEWGPRKKPSLRYLSASYSQTLTIRDNRRRKAILMDEKYKKLWPAVKIDQARTADENFGNTMTGWCIATSTGGVGTGERADRVICTPYDSMILTDLGWMKIGDVVNGRLQVGIAGWDRGRGIVWQKIEAYETNPGRPLCEITFDGGSILLTEDHPVWVNERGYVAAIDVRPGETVRTFGLEGLRALRGDNLGQAESDHQAAVVFASLPRFGGARGSASEQLHAMPELREANLQTTIPRRPHTQWSFLFSCLSWRMESWRTKSHVYRSARRCMRLVHQAISQAAEKARMLFSRLRYRQNTSGYSGSLGRKSSMPGMQIAFCGPSQGAKILFENMCVDGSRQENGKYWEWPLRSWSGGETLSARMDEDIQGQNQGSRWPLLPVVWDDASGSWSESGCSPYQLPEDGHVIIEPNNAMPILPREDARASERAVGMGCATVLSVARTGRTPSRTYNLRVMPNHNYFIEGILLHNCDDVHSVNTADSDAVRAQTLHWWREVIPTRVNDPVLSAFIVVMQRVHEDDVAGDILENRGGDFTHVMIPMRYDPTRHCVTNQGEDPRTEEGELYWPERFPEWTVDRDEIPLGRFGVAAQFQQIPSPRGGGIVLREHWKIWPPIDEVDRWVTQTEEENGKARSIMRFPAFDLVIAYVDTAFTSKEENAYCACVRFAVFADNAGRPKIMMAQAWRDRPTLRNLSIRLLETCRAGHVDALVIENKAGAEWVKQELMMLMKAGEFSIILDDPRGDKVARLHSVAPLFEDGIVHAPDRVWADMVINEVSSFPKGKFMDLTDCVSGGLGYLRRNDLIKLSSEHDEDVREAGLFKGNRPGVAERYGVT